MVVVRRAARPVVVSAYTSPVSTIFVQGQLAYLRSQGFHPVVVCSPGQQAEEVAREEGADYRPVPMERNPRPIADLCSLVTLIRLFREIRPDVVNAGTPKAGLLASLAAYLTRVPVRIYTLHGFRHESSSGLQRHLLVFLERLACSVVHRVVAVSPSVLEMGESLSIIPRGKGLILASGSSGVDVAGFRARNPSPSDRAATRAALGIPDDAVVIGFVGRLVKRKGIGELLQAWSALRKDHPELFLLIVGGLDDAQPLPRELLAAIARDERIIAAGHSDDVARMMGSMDVFALPAHWEGFGNVLVEAAALGLPVVSTTGTGTRDAVRHGHNGTLVPVHDVAALTDALRSYIVDPKLRALHGSRGPEWAERFDKRHVWRALVSLYRELLGVYPATR